MAVAGAFGALLVSRQVIVLMAVLSPHSGQVPHLHQVVHGVFINSEAAASRPPSCQLQAQQQALHLPDEQQATSNKQQKAGRAQAQIS